MNIALFGGSFDMVHNGHIAIVDALQNYTNEQGQKFDKILVIPANISPFKKEIYKTSTFNSNYVQNITDEEHKYNMLQLAFADKVNNGIVEISRVEIDRDPPSYTADTIRLIEQQYNNANLTLCMGIDAYHSFERWKEVDYIKQKCNILLLARQGITPRQESLDNSNPKMRILSVVIPKISSSSIRVDIVFGKLEQLAPQILPQSVVEYIQKNHLYTNYQYIVDKYQDYHLEPERIEHIERVAQTALEIYCNTQEPLSAAKVITAALLHDIGKRVSWTTFKDNPKYQPSIFPQINQWQELSKNVIHAHIGAVIARQDFAIYDKNILKAIKYHTTGKPNMDALSKVIYLADAVEPQRKNVDTIRQLALQGDLDRAMYLALQHSIQNLTERKETIQQVTLDAYAYYQQLATH